MDYFHLTAPCGLDCFNCPFYRAAENDPDALETVTQMSAQYQIPVDVMLCRGCRHHDGRIPLQQHVFGEAHRCAAYECIRPKAIDFCGACDAFPCDHLHPYADKAGELPHNIKVFNLCLINRLGLEEWARTRAAEVRRTYFTHPWTLA